MIVFIGIVMGAAGAWLAAKRGLYEIWAFFFSLVISIYLGIYLRETAMTHLTFLENLGAYGDTFALIGVAVICFSILYGFTYVFFLSQSTVNLPKIVDKTGAVVCGFLSGLLLFSFINVLISASPLHNNPVAEFIGLKDKPAQMNITTIDMLCGAVNVLVSNKNSVSPAENITFLNKNIERRTQNLQDREQANDEQQAPPEIQEPQTPLERLGPPPDVNVDEL